jgi:hypothetical protein
MILDAHGVPFPETSIGQQYAEALARSWRDTLLTRIYAAEQGWTCEQTQRYIETGEEPAPVAGITP